MDLDFAMCRPLVRRLRLISGFCSSARTFDPRFLQTPPRDGSPCVSLTLHLHQVGWKDRKSTRLNFSHVKSSYAVYCLKKKKKTDNGRYKYKKNNEQNREPHRQG